MVTHTYTAEDAKNKLIAGNRKFVAARAASVDASEAVLKASLAGQSPYAAVITCSDSRVIPEAIFSAGIGELFVIRVAGNVIDTDVLGSIEYASAHLGTELVVVLGHDHCGAVDAALNHHNTGYTKHITDAILKAIGNERNELKASCLNAAHGCEVIKSSLPDIGITVVGAVYHLASGEVEFL